MSKRSIFSIILILLAVGVMLIDRGIVGGLIGSFLLVVMLFLWVIPSNFLTPHDQEPDPAVKRASQTVLGIGLGLFVAVALALILPPQIFSWVIIAAGIMLIIWMFVRLIK